MPKRKTKKAAKKPGKKTTRRRASTPDSILEKIEDPKTSLDRKVILLSRLIHRLLMHIEQPFEDESGKPEYVRKESKRAAKTRQLRQAKRMRIARQCKVRGLSYKKWLKEHGEVEPCEVLGPLPKHP